MNRRYVRTRASNGAWNVLDTGCDPARVIATVYEDCNDAHEACQGLQATVQHVLELLNRDNEMRVSVDTAARRGHP